MIEFNRGWPKLRALALVCVTALSVATTVGATQPSVSNASLSADDAGSSVMQQHAARFWQTMAAKPADRAQLLQRHFSARLLQGNGADSLLETFDMLAEALGPGMATLTPDKLLGSADDAELQYTLIDGRRVALKLTLTAGAQPQIDRFGVMPLAQVVAAVKPEQLSATIAAHVIQEFAAERFSGAVLVARGDTLIHAQAIGMADRKAGRANTLDTPINLGSINKMFTSIAIAQLQASGKLDWHDTVGKHLPDFPNAKIRDEVTIHQLLTHTSGVGSYWNEAHDARRNEIDTQQEFLATFVAKPLAFEPGQGIEYSNGGPVILGLIIEALSGMDYYDYVRQHVYQPAGMLHADHYRRDDATAGFALGYVRTEKGDWRDNRQDLSMRGSAAGGGYASAHDLYAFSRALRTHSLLTRDQLEVLWKPHTQPGPIGYGYLFSVGETGGKRWIGHNGGAAGISAEFMHYTDDGLVIIVLANQDNAASTLREWLYALLDASLSDQRKTNAAP